jgi:polyphosphate kinase
MKNTADSGQQNLNRRFFNRELSWIDFNERVLEEGLRRDLPVLDRFRFFAIVSSNFDEFFMVRIAALKRALRAGTAGTAKDPSGLSVEAQLKTAAGKIRSIFGRQAKCLKEEIFPILAREGLELVRPDSYSLAQMDYLESFFMREIYPVLTPLRIGKNEPFPFIESLCLHAAFLLTPEGDGPDPVSPAFAPLPEEGELISVIRIPPVLNRIIWLPQGAGKKQWALLEDVVMIWGAYLYPGYRVRESMFFQVNRDADFSVDEKRDEDFIEAMEEVLEDREKSMPVGMLFSPGSERLRTVLARGLNLEDDDLYEIEGLLNPGNLMDLTFVQGFDHLREKPWKIYDNLAFTEDGSLWDRISQGDVIIHLPYQSFDPVVRFFQDAAVDPAVISIKTALYRTSGNSPVIRALEQAALNGKHVTAIVELKARFDEERNISWANRLEKAGVIVIYGLARLKVHAKVSLIIRRENDRIKRYIHLSTGNYNDKTAKLYEDICLFTARDEIAYDGGLLFNMITGYSVIHLMRRLLIAPTNLKRRLLELIDRETKRSRPEAPGKIMAKMNALADTDIIEALYRASQAGVKVLLNVRGICMLVPGAAGLSENIRVVSVIDRYLEHSRIYYFANAGAEEIFLSSADWMPRNLERRIELMFPAIQEDIKSQIRDILASYFRDNCQAWLLQSDGTWAKITPPEGEKPFRVQAAFHAQAAAAAERLKTFPAEFIVRRSPPGEG